MKTLYLFSELSRHFFLKEKYFYDLKCSGSSFLLVRLIIAVFNQDFLHFCRHVFFDIHAFEKKP